MSFSEIKKISLINMKNHWIKLSLITLIYLLFNFSINLIPIVGFVFMFIFSTPISYGYILSLIKTINNEKISVIDFLILGFKNTGKAWRIIGNVFVRLFIPILILFGFAVLVAYNSLPILEALINNTLTLDMEISPFITIGLFGYIITLIYIAYKFLSYSLCFYLMIDYPQENGSFIIKKSTILMKGKILKLIGFFLSFIGWIILSILTFGIGFVLLIPYIYISLYYFYKNISPETV